MPAEEMGLLYSQIRQARKLAEETDDHHLRQSLLRRADEIEARIAILTTPALTSAETPSTGQTISEELAAVFNVFGGPEPEAEGST